MGATFPVRLTTWLWHKYTHDSCSYLQLEHDQTQMSPDPTSVPRYRPDARGPAVRLLPCLPPAQLNGEDRAARLVSGNCSNGFSLLHESLTSSDQGNRAEALDARKSYTTVSARERPRPSTVVRLKRSGKPIRVLRAANQDGGPPCTSAEIPTARPAKDEVTRTLTALCFVQQRLLLSNHVDNWVPKETRKLHLENQRQSHCQGNLRPRR